MTRKDFLSWSQTRGYTCGAASLMVVLSELSGFELSEKNEMKIWEKTHSKGYKGILPGYLGIYAKEKGLAAEIYCSKGVFKQRQAEMPLTLRLIYSILKISNDIAFIKAKKRGIKVHYIDEKKDDLEFVVKEIQDNKNLNVLMVVKLYDDELHYLLLRSDDFGHVIVMDSQFGTNSSFHPVDFLEYHKSIRIGIYVAIANSLF